MLSIAVSKQEDDGIDPPCVNGLSVWSESACPPCATVGAL